MAGSLIPEKTTWSGVREDDGFVTFTLKQQVQTDYEDGPWVAMNTPGLAAIGSPWAYGNDFHPWVFCTPYMKCDPRISNEPNRFWDIEQRFTNKPVGRCSDTEVEDPLMEPDRIAGSFVKRVEEALQDRHGDLLKYSSHEPITGPQTEFDHSYPTVVISQNVQDLQLDLLAQCIDNVNSGSIWGLPSRTVKLSNVSWERVVFGQCGYFFTRTLEFEIDYRTFDREIFDMGSRALWGEWDDKGWSLKKIGNRMPDPDNPQHFRRYQDRAGNYTIAYLDGAGKPIENEADRVSKFLEYYQEIDFFIFGVPFDLAA